MNPRLKFICPPARLPGWSAALVLAALALSVAASPAFGDGGGWPTATPTPTTRPLATLEVTPLTAKDVLIPTNTPVIQGDAPLPRDPFVLPAESIQADPEGVAPAPPSEAVQSGGFNWRLLGIGGGIAAGLVLVVLLFFRLR